MQTHTHTHTHTHPALQRTICHFHIVVLSVDRVKLPRTYWDGRTYVRSQAAVIRHGWLNPIHLYVTHTLIFVEGNDELWQIRWGCLINDWRKLEPYIHTNYLPGSCWCLQKPNGNEEEDVMTQVDSWSRTWLWPTPDFLTFWYLEESQWATRRQPLSLLLKSVC